MTLHKIALATIMTSATALGAFAADDKIFEKGHAKPDPADVAASPNERVDIDTYDERGHTRKSVDTETTMEEDAGIMDDLSAVEPVSVARTESENIIEQAEMGTPVYTVDGDMIGAVSGHQAHPTEGHVVMVDVAAEAGLPAGGLAFPVATLQVLDEGDALEYHSGLAHLEDAIIEKMG